RFRVLGDPAWTTEIVRPLIEARVRDLQVSGRIEGYEFTRYLREIERYGGFEGMELAERLYHLDSLACLELIAAERRGTIKTSRRQFSMVMVDRLLDLARFDLEQRLAFYSFGYRYERETDT